MVDGLVDVNHAGNYSFELRINNDTGDYVSYAWNTSTLQIGTNPISFVFDGKNLYDYGQNTSFIIECIEIYDNNGDSVGNYFPYFALNYYEFNDFQSFLSIMDSFSEDVLMLMLIVCMISW